MLLTPQYHIGLGESLFIYHNQKCVEFRNIRYLEMKRMVKVCGKYLKMTHCNLLILNVLVRLIYIGRVTLGQ